MTFYLTVIESDGSYENIVYDFTSNKQIETPEFYNMNQNNIIDFTRRYNNSEVTLYCGKCNPNFVCQDEYKLNPDELLPLIITDGDLYVEKEI